MDARKILARNVQRLRHAKGFSQEELSHRAAIHHTYISGIETGRRNPSVLVLQHLAKGLGIAIADLFQR